MQTEKKWKKWEGKGQPPGRGGESIPESQPPAEVAGHEWRMKLIQCFVCGAPSLIMRDADWYTCWKCGATVSASGG